MTFLSFSKVLKEMKGKVHEDKGIDKAALKKEITMSAVTVTETDKKYANL